jgi:hypothetical protein
MKEQEAAAAYLRGDLTFSEFSAAVAKFFKFDFRNDSRAVHCTPEVPFEITVTPNDLRPMLQAYLAGGKSASDVSCWASVILLVPVFVRPESEGRPNDPAEYMWHLVWDLSNPPIARAVTTTTVERVLRKLVSIEHQLAGA